MLRILRFLWTGSWHEHIWETVKTVEVDGGYRGCPPSRTWTRFYCRCKVCGTIKKFD